MDLITERLKLKDIRPDKAKEIAKSLKLKEDEIPFIRKGITPSDLKIEDDERAIISYINTNVIDRDRDIVASKGARLKNYQNHPVVFFGHNYQGLPIGKNLWIKSDDKGLIAKTIYDESEEADRIYEYRKRGFPLAESIGFIPYEWVEGDKIQETDFSDLGLSAKDTKGAQRVFTDWELLEYSDVTVPANPEALQLAISKGIITEKQLTEEQKTMLQNIEDKEEDKEEIKRVIPYKETPKAPEDTPWQAGREVREAEVSDLKIMCTWYDAENPDIKGSYKLPHHKASGAHPVVWRGVAAAMGALLGARGGVNIPDGDRKGCYNHLKKHYKQFDKEPPDFREYSEEELKELFPDEYMVLTDENTFIKAMALTLLNLNNEICELKKIIEELKSKIQESGGLKEAEGKYLQSFFDGLPNINTVVTEKKNEEIIEIIESEDDDEFDIDPEEIKKIVKDSIKDLNLAEIAKESVEIAKGKIIEE